MSCSSEPIRPSAEPASGRTAPIRSWIHRLFSKDIDSTLSADERKRLAEFEKRLDYRFKDESLLILALTHRSFAFQEGNDRCDSNERLEFLGDSVIGLLINEALIREHPLENEGVLTQAKSVLASRVVLGEVAETIGLGAALRVSTNEDESGGRERESILADAFEAVLGAIYLDGGLDPARDLIRRMLWIRKDDFLDDESHRNYKSQLQERVQSRYKSPPRYRISSTSGPDHSKAFVVEVLVQGEVAGTGSGRSKKDAEQDAAKLALDRFPEEEATG